MTPGPRFRARFPVPSASSKRHSDSPSTGGISAVEQDAPNHSAKDSEYSVGCNGVFVQSEVVIENQGGRLGAISVCGQVKRTVRPFGRAKSARGVRPNFTRPKQSNPTTWRLAAMNMAICGIYSNFGKQPADTFLSDQHADLRADTAARVSAKPTLRRHAAGLIRSERKLLANPNFNDFGWFRKDDEARSRFGIPTKGNGADCGVQNFYRTSSLLTRPCRVPEH